MTTRNMVLKQFFMADYDPPLLVWEGNPCIPISVHDFEAKEYFQDLECSLTETDTKLKSMRTDETI